MKFVREGHKREFIGKDKTPKQLRAKAWLRGFNGIPKFKKAQAQNCFQIHKTWINWENEIYWCKQRSLE